MNDHTVWHSHIDMWSSQNSEQLILNTLQITEPRLKMECCFHTRKWMCMPDCKRNAAWIWAVAASLTCTHSKKCCYPAQDSHLQERWDPEEKVKELVTQSCPTLCNSMDYSLCPWNSPGKNTGVGSHSFFRGSSPSRDQTQVSGIAGRFFIVWATPETRDPEDDHLLPYVRWCVGTQAGL